MVEIDPHPDRDDRAESDDGRLGKAIAAAILVAILIAIVALHLAGAMSGHGS